MNINNIILIPSSGINQNVSQFNQWSPEINHGYYYSYSGEHYLFSDDSIVQYPKYLNYLQGIESGLNYVVLNEMPKVGPPILCRQYKWNGTEYEIHNEINKKVEFAGLLDDDYEYLDTYDGTNIFFDNIDHQYKEFMVTNSGEVIATFNKQYVEHVENDIVGIFTGQEGQQFYTTYSPIDSGMQVLAKTYLTIDGTMTTWSGVNQTPIANQFFIDYDLGILEFPDVTGLTGNYVSMDYYKTFALEYEPTLSTDYIYPLDVNLNPIYRSGYKGFVYLSRAQQYPTSITLTAELDLIQLDVFGPAYIGSTYIPIIATVYDANGNVLEGQSVSFNITTVPLIGSFGSASATTTSVTDEFGESRVYYNTPNNISDIGEEVPFSRYATGVNTVTLTTNNLSITGDAEDIYTYQTHIDEPIMGYLNTSISYLDQTLQLTKYYGDFSFAEGIYGTTSGINWEAPHRVNWDLPTPLIFGENLGYGTRKLCSIFSPDYTNPHTFVNGAIGPFLPVNYTDLENGSFEIVYDTSTYSMPAPTASDTPPADTLYSYFVVAPTQVKIQATVYNQFTSQTLKSNEITLKLQVPDYMNGVWTMDAINENHIEEISSLLETMTATGQKVPLGFRLRSSSVTLAAALDGLTFLDLNDSSNYDPYDIDNLDNVRLLNEFNVNTIV